jgi:hypothetical protein
MSKKLRHLPLKGILDRDIAVAETESLISEWSPYLEELVNFATHALARCQESLKGVEGTPASLIHLYYHIIQMADGVQVLCSNACFQAAFPLVRSIWEGNLFIQYMLEEGHFENRSTAWLACSHLEGKEVWLMQDLTSQRGQDIESMRQKDKYLGSADVLEKDQDIVKEQIALYDAMLQKSKFSSVLAKLSNSAKKNKRWYSVNSDLNTIKDLAKHLGRSLEYELIYSNLSAVSHAKDASRTITTREGTAYLTPIRADTDGQTVYSHACAYLMDATWMIMTKLRSAEDIRKQLKEIAVRHRRIAPKLKSV